MKHAAALLAVIALIMGCATTEPPSEQSLIMDVVSGWAEGIESADPAMITANYADSYKDSLGSNSKAEAVAAVEQYAANGTLDGAVLGLEDASIILDGTAAEYGPIDFYSDAGESFTLRLYFQKIDGEWLIVETTSY